MVRVQAGGIRANARKARKEMMIKLKKFRNPYYVPGDLSIIGPCINEAWGPGHDEPPWGPEGPCPCAEFIWDYEDPASDHQEPLAPLVV